MYNIFYNLEEFGADGVTFNSYGTTVVKAFMDAVHEMRRVLKTKDVELLQVEDMEFAIWAFGMPQGYLSIKEVGPKTSAPDLESG